MLKRLLNFGRRLVSRNPEPFKPSLNWKQQKCAFCQNMITVDASRDNSSASCYSCYQKFSCPSYPGKEL